MTKLSTGSGLRSTPPIVVVVGETASGKSGLAMEIAQKFDGEIINADSWQVYKGFDVGTAKPTKQDMAKIPHHLIDIVEPDDHFSAAIYKGLANQAIEAVTSRQKLPVMVGGTGLYIDGVLFDFSFLPTGKGGVREKLNKLSIHELLGIIKNRNIDLAGIDTRNKRRLVRLLETGGKRPQKAAKMRPNTLVIGLKIPRTKLRENIENRTELMFRKGLKKEVKDLANKYGWDNEAMKGIGYKEFKPYFAGEVSVGEVKRKIIKNTLELAKRQRTWFKRNRQIHWIENAGEAMKLVEQFKSAT